MRSRVAILLTLWISLLGGISTAKSTCGKTLDDSNQPIQSFLWGLDVSNTMDRAGGAGGLLAIHDHASGDTHFACADGNGNLTTLVNQTGTVTNSGNQQQRPCHPVLKFCSGSELLRERSGKKTAWLPFYLATPQHTAPPPSSAVLEPTDALHEALRPRACVRKSQRRDSSGDAA